MKEKLIKLLKEVNELFKPSTKEVAIRKDGFGHDDEHTDGAQERTHELVNIFIANKTEEMKANPKYDIDRSISATVAAFHDIGNLIDRDTHNHLARGIIQGHLSYCDILSVPNTDLTKEEQDRFFDLFQNDDRKQIEDLMKDQTYRSIIIDDVFVPKAIFEIGYNGKNVNEIITNIDYTFDLKTQDLVDLIKRIEDIKDTNAEKLRNITKEVHQIFDQDKIKTIAEAVQDHNIDYNNDGTRYFARNIYGSIMADADKDNIPMTFALRTFAYAINKWVKKNDFFVDENDKPDYFKCCAHILHQSWERFRVDDQGAPFESMHIYKPLEKINGVEDVLTNNRVNAYIECGLTEQDAIEAVALENKYKIYTVPETTKDYNGREIECQDAGKKFFVLSKDGADTFSQTDEILKKEGVMNEPHKASKEKFYEIISLWARTDLEKANVEDLVGFMKKLWDRENSTIAAMVNIGENLKWGKGRDYIDIKAILDEDKEYPQMNLGTADSEYNQFHNSDKVIEDVTRDIDDFER